MAAMPPSGSKCSKAAIRAGSNGAQYPTARSPGLAPGHLKAHPRMLRIRMVPHGGHTTRFRVLQTWPCPAFCPPRDLLSIPDRLVEPPPHVVASQLVPPAHIAGARAARLPSVFLGTPLFVLHKKGRQRTAYETQGNLAGAHLCIS